MRNKIPVGATIAQAYRFAFGNFLAVLGLILAPLVAQALLGIVMLGRITAVMNGLMAQDPAAIGQVGPVLLFYAVTFLLAFVMYTAVSEYALGLRPASWFALPFGKPLWRMIGAALLGMVALAIAALVFLLGCFLLAIAAKMAVGNAGIAKLVLNLIALAALLVGYGAFIYATVRLFFVMGPVTLAGGRIDVAATWRLTKGNFWRMFIILLALLLPVMAIEYGAMIAAAGLPPTLPHGTSPQALADLRQAKLAYQAALMTRMAANWYIVYPLFGLLAVFLYGSGCAAQAFAWRALTGGSAPVPGDTLP